MHSNNYILVALSVLFLVSCKTERVWVVKSVEGKDIIFANGDTIKTTLNGLRYYDSINS